MRRRKTLVFILLCFGAVGGGAIWLASNSPARGQSQGDAGASPNSIARLDAKAGAAKSGDEAAIRELTDGIVSSFSSDDVPAGMMDGAKDRLVRAEVAYRTGHGKGVSEFNIVRTINGLAKKLGTPDYAKTNIFEMRRMELALLPFAPNLLQPQRSRQGDLQGASINAEFSPLQAVFVAGMLIQEKRYSPDYQLTQDEWVALHGGKRTAHSNADFRTGLEARRSDPTRKDELERAIEAGTNKMSSAELLNLPHKILDALGIEQSEGRSTQ